MNTNRKYADDSIIDVTNKPYYLDLKKQSDKKNVRAPFWAHQYICSCAVIKTASSQQKIFYNVFKTKFLNNTFLSLKGNLNYAFILLFDLIDQYQEHRNIFLVEQQLLRLTKNYPKTRSCAYKALARKLRQLKEYDTINLLRQRHGSFYSNNQSSEYLQDHANYWGIGNKYKTHLKLTADQVTLLNTLRYPDNNFCNIEYCCIEVLKFFLVIMSALKEKYLQEETSLDAEFSAVAELITRKHFEYKKGSQNYSYCIELTTKEIYTNIFKYCENAVREFYGHKRKVNTDTYYNSSAAETVLETRIISKIKTLLPEHISKVNSPDERTEIELNAQNTTRWKIHFEELTKSYTGKSEDFIESVISLGKLNIRNPSVENIYYEASRFISKHDRESALCLYIYYLYYDLKSPGFDHKQLSKTIQKCLFQSNEQLHHFEIIISEFIADRDLHKALKNVSRVYEVKRKKIILDQYSIKDVQQQHSGTVALLNDYLKDDFEDDNTIIKSQVINTEDINIEIMSKNDRVSKSGFISSLALSDIHTTALSLFAKSNFSLHQNELETFAKSKGVFKNQLIESINDTCYELLDDVLIEEEDDYYILNTDYFERISANDQQH